MNVLRAALAVGIITGWVLALVWFATAVTQIAVDRVLISPCAVSAPEESC